MFFGFRCVGIEINHRNKTQVPEACDWDIVGVANGVFVRYRFSGISQGETESPITRNAGIRNSPGDDRIYLAQKASIRRDIKFVCDHPYITVAPESTRK